VFFKPISVNFRLFNSRLCIFGQSGLHGIFWHRLGWNLKSGVRIPDLHLGLIMIRSSDMDLDGHRTRVSGYFWREFRYVVLAHGTKTMLTYRLRNVFCWKSVNHNITTVNHINKLPYNISALFRKPILLPSFQAKHSLS